MTAAEGEQAWAAAFWSQAEVSQSAATATGIPPPITQPKKRPPAVLRSPGCASSWSSSMTRSGGRPRAGSGLRSRAHSACGSGSSLTR